MAANDLKNKGMSNCKRNAAKKAQLKSIPFSVMLTHPCDVVRDYHINTCVCSDAYVCGWGVWPANTRRVAIMNPPTHTEQDTTTTETTTGAGRAGCR